MSQFLDRDMQILTKRYLTTRDAYVTGYFFTTIDSVPPSFVKYMKEEYTGSWNEDKIITAFTSLSIDVALPQETLKTLSKPGRGGYTRTSPLFSQKGNSISVSFLVDQTLESSTLFIGWYEYITKVADGRLEVTGVDNTTNIYGSNFYYCTLLPNMKDVLFAFVGEGLYPINNPANDFSHNVSNYENLRHTMQFNIDYYKTWTFGKKKDIWLKQLLENKIDNLRTDLINLSLPSSDLSANRDLTPRFGGDENMVMG